MNTTIPASSLILDDLEDIYDALNGFNYMLGASFTQGATPSDLIATGITVLLRRQIDDMREVISRVEAEFRNPQKEQSSGDGSGVRTVSPIEAAEDRLRQLARQTMPVEYDPDALATASGLSRASVIKVINAMKPAMQLPEDSNDEVTPEALREALVAEKLKAGLELAVIAKAMNMTTASAEAIAGKVCGEASAISSPQVNAI